MANLKEIRSRISSVGSTMQITSAMKMVSAAKLKRAQDAVTQMRPYSNKLTELLVNLSSTLDSSDGGVYSEKRDTNKVLLVTITSNRGLCGGFNANIIKKAPSGLRLISINLFKITESILGSFNLSEIKVAILMDCKKSDDFSCK